MELTQFGVSGAVVVVVIMFLRFMQAENARRDKMHQEFTQAIKLNAAATEKNTQMTEQTYQFLQNLNGSLRVIVAEKQIKAKGGR